MRIGIDIDGVLADFTQSYVDVARKRGAQIPQDYTVENYDYKACGWGIDKGMESLIWGDIKASPSFWMDLRPIDWNLRYMSWFWLRVLRQHDQVFFITSRPESTGPVPIYVQTMEWLSRYVPEFKYPCVIVESHKGALAKELRLDYFYDDKWENCLDVKRAISSCAVFLQEEPYNAMNHAKAKQLGMHVVALLDAMKNHIACSVAP